MHYTLYKDDAIEKKIEEDLSITVNRVIKLLGNSVHSILLTGGFGRGEGSVSLKDGKIKIINDYDILIVPNIVSRLSYIKYYRKFRPKLNQLAEILATKLEVKQIDLDLQHFSYFKGNNPLRIENFEVLKGHKLIYGEQDPCQWMPDYRPEDISLFEGAWLFRNRGGGLIIAAKYFISRGYILKEKKENFIIECNKAILAIGDSILLLKRKYHHLYHKRKEIIQNLDISDIAGAFQLVTAYIEAIDHKLRPDFSAYYKKNMIDWWYEVQGLFDLFYRFFESKRLGISFRDWLEYTKIPKPEANLEMRVILGNMIRGGPKAMLPVALRRSILKARRDKFISLIALLLFSVNRDDFNETYLTKVAEMLGYNFNGDHLLNWKHLTDIFLQIWHPSGEAGRVIGL